MYLSMLISIWKWQFCIIYTLAQFDIRSSSTVVIRHKLWTKVSLCLAVYKKIEHKSVLRKRVTIFLQDKWRMQKEKEQKHQWEDIGQNAKWNFWCFNSLIIVKLLIGFATDRNFVLGYEEREWMWLIGVLWRSPSWWSGKSWKEMEVWVNRSLNGLVFITSKLYETNRRAGWVTTAVSKVWNNIAHTACVTWCLAKGNCFLHMLPCLVPSLWPSGGYGQTTSYSWIIRCMFAAYQQFSRNCLHERLAVKKK